MRAVVLGYHDMGHDCLQVLLEAGLEVVAVYTHRDDPAEGAWFRSVADLARERGLPVLTPGDINEPASVERLLGQAPDIIFSFYYRQLVHRRILAIPPSGCFNLHGSLLPRFRGRCPVNWVLIHGERETGVTLHHMVSRADAGDIVGQRRIAIAPQDDAHSLHDKVVHEGAGLLRDLLPAIRAGNAPRIRQDVTRGSYCNGRRPEDGIIDWSRSAIEIHNLVRGVTHPFPGARTTLDGRTLLIWQTEPEPPRDSRDTVPGRLVGDGSLSVETGDGLLRVLRCQFAGDTECDGDGLVRSGAVRGGARLGAQGVCP